MVDPGSPKTYQLDRTGRRTALLVGVGAFAVWIFALWKLPDVLSSDAVAVSYLRPATFGAAIGQGLQVNQLIPALLLVVLIVAIPLLIWNVAEEWSTRYTVYDDGLAYDTVQGIQMFYPWSAITTLRRIDPEAHEPVDELIVDYPSVSQIRSRVLRWLHRQAFGRRRIVIYAHVTDRDELLAEIAARSGLRPLQNESFRS